MYFWLFALTTCRHSHPLNRYHIRYCMRQVLPFISSHWTLSFYTVIVYLFIFCRQHSELLVFLSWLQHARSKQSRCSLHYSDQWDPLSPVFIHSWDEDVSFLSHVKAYFNSKLDIYIYSRLAKGTPKVIVAVWFTVPGKFSLSMKLNHNLPLILQQWLVTVRMQRSQDQHEDHLNP